MAFYDSFPSHRGIPKDRHPSAYQGFGREHWAREKHVRQEPLRARETPREHRERRAPRQPDPPAQRDNLDHSNENHEIYLSQVLAELRTEKRKREAAEKRLKDKSNALAENEATFAAVMDQFQHLQLREEHRKTPLEKLHHNDLHGIQHHHEQGAMREAEKEAMGRKDIDIIRAQMMIWVRQLEHIEDRGKREVQRSRSAEMTSVVCGICEIKGSMKWALESALFDT
ncbi:uncharacterized protein BDR25DRAFT_317104 [Lindgomyces ingoldianus]|uniref:Uncharacterized protein n=1 Tax=Lindgomyces ingoldianus TaxID=673940 RepID=A0ACB6QML1_9PLEO|nr:uncharacterized protein BDR25DRAFT_317104 [Lindgomyces ingoldianus]KAF2467362.1 hypothetical protein BDR25DRAFT_317104 [Lindgomyces ingoldianus]